MDGMVKMIIKDKRKEKFKNIYRRWFYRRIIKKFLKDCNTIISIGCGIGLFYDEAHTLKKVVSGIDLDERYKRGSIIIKDFRDINKSYDCFFNSHFIEHVNQFEFMDIVKKYCKKKIITIAGRPCKKFWDTPDHIRPYTLKAIKNLYEDYGFKTIYAKNLFPTNSFIVIGEKDETK